MLSRTHQYQSMFVNADATIKSKQSVEIKLKCWMFIVSLLAIYFFFIMVYYVSITYIFKGQVGDTKFTETFSSFLMILAHLSLDITLYYYTHSGYRFDAVINDEQTRNRTNTWVASMISARAHSLRYGVAEDMEDNEMEFSLSETTS